ncbi:Exocyst complex component [Komagataella phaffii CBS 7435]|uniref:Exocyst complex component SEC5 n=2 Tax=Komagataella phaffii TaxID=460519 RepID=C4R5S5_KOMPG|nr:uncharacterized protein PAS_chr3_1229 [Komagataella phaffii GS115]AOA64124.1 GQ67_03972T0 [Komagataella phaffii]CAH2449278.1 Exocyst complex component [Komagataella phaffii CBS 7435]AOA68512.1 GQ68_03945T0 [Komagataella phaffii GS115]CAY70911.1 hypothetical protein PAS_chr3_1229 [Komagataella phaffii GS115]CCA39291.1 Exocyst complex component [Komagataella phaffii CBS 7435]
MNTDEILSFYRLKSTNPQSWNRDVVDLEFNYPESEKIADNLDLLKRLIDHETSTKTIQDPKNNNKLNTEDPLGFRASVLDELIDNEVIDDTRDDKKFDYLISSHRFKPDLFLRNVHPSLSASDLKQGLSYLEHDVKSKNKDLQLQIESEFLVYIKSKNSLDRIFKQFDNMKLIGKGDANGGKEAAVDYLKNLIEETMARSNELLKPVLEEARTETALKHTLEYIQKNSIIFDLPKSLQNSIQKNDYSSFISDYITAKESKERLMDDGEVSGILLRVWDQVELLVSNFRELLWDQLVGVHLDEIDEKSINYTNYNHEQSVFLNLINKLLEIGVEDSPIMGFLECQFANLSRDILFEANSSHLTVLIRSQKRLKQNYTQTEELLSEVLANNGLNFLTSQLKHESITYNHYDIDLKRLDLPLVNSMWEQIEEYIGFLTNFLNHELLLFVSICQYFKNGNYQKQIAKTHLVDRIPQNSKAHVQLTESDMLRINMMIEKLIYDVCSCLNLFFKSNDDTLIELTDQTSREQLADKDLQYTGITSDFGFIPCFSNAVSALKYLNRFQNNLLDVFARLYQQSESWGLRPDVLDQLNLTNLKINGRIISGVLAYLINDVKEFYKLENWQTSTMRQGCTLMPLMVHFYYNNIIRDLKNIVFAVTPHENTFQVIERQLLNSFQLLVENLLKKGLYDSQTNSSEQDFFQKSNEYKLITLTNLIKLKSSVFVDAIKLYDSLFDRQLYDDNLEIFVKLDNLELTLFQNYTLLGNPIITKIVNKGIDRKDWQTEQPPKDVSSYAHHLLNFLTLVKTKLLRLDIPEQLANRILDYFHDYSTKKILDSFNRIHDFSTYGLYQCCCDLDYLQRQMGAHLSSEGVSRFKVIYDTIISPKIDVAHVKHSVSEIVNRYS